ncbi:MAG: hypothetical protein AAGE03_16295, partial [Pseudomonadota bacterium]
RRSSRVWLALLPVGALIAGGVWYQNSAAVSPTIDVAAPVDIAARGDRPQAAPAAPVLETAAQDIPAETGPVTSTASTVPTSCEGMIERRLGEIRQTAQTYDDGLAWSDYRTTITSLVQQVLNCPAAGLDVVGSLELLDTDLADLQVSWDMATDQMTLTTIVDGGPALALDQGDHINFVLR